MFAFGAGRPAANVGRARFAPSLVPVLACVAAVCQSGCAADGNPYYARAPMVAAYVAQAPAVEMEDDGLPSQAPPSVRVRQMPDDPSQPYSRNYGGSNPAMARAAPLKAASMDAPPKPAIPADLPPDFRRQLAAAIDTAD